MARGKKSRPKSGTSHRTLPPPTQDYTLRQVAEALQVSRQTVRRLVNSGQIPYRRVGRQFRFDIVSVRGALDRVT